MNFSFHPEAELELNLSINYYEDCSKGLGTEFAIEAYSTIQRIIEHPMAWAVLEDNVRRNLTRRFPDVIINDDIWHNVVFISYGNTGDKVVYVDGNLQSTFTKGTNQETTEGYYAFGGYWMDKGLYRNNFQGEVDEVLIYNRALSKSEIQAIYNETENSASANITDSDNDGVIDQWDNCPNPLPNSFTNKQGCSAEQLGQTPDAIYDEGKQFCVDNPEECGWASGGYTQADLDAKYNDGKQAGYSEGISSCDDSVVPTSDGNCAMLESNFNITMPCIDVFGNKLPIGLERSTYPDDPFGYYWKLNLQ